MRFVAWGKTVFSDKFPGFVAFIYTYLSILDICAIHLVIDDDDDDELFLWYGWPTKRV